MNARRNSVIGISLMVAGLVGGIRAFAQHPSDRGANPKDPVPAVSNPVLLSAVTTIPPENHELADLLKRVADAPENLDRDADGNTVFLALRGTNANDRALFLASHLRSLRELTIQGRGRQETGQWSREGISHLHGLAHLEKLRVLCVSTEPSVESDDFHEICSLAGLKTLVLCAACPKQADYAWLTNLQNLVELDLSYATNFGDGELCLITNMPRLRNVQLSYDGISREGTNVFRWMPGLTNSTVHFRKAER